MAKSRQQKEQIVADATDRFKRMKSAAFTSISGYTMEQANELQNRAAEVGVDVFIAKKSLLSIAAKEAGVEGLNPRDFSGSILTAVSFDDEVSAAKLLKDFQKENEDFVLVGGVLEGKVVDSEGVEKLASLPSKEQLLGQLVGTLNAPVSGFVNVLAGNLRGLVTVLSAIRDQK